METKLSVEEATNIVFSQLENYTCWKFLKSQRCLKKKIRDIELIIFFYTSKWNHSYEYTGLNAEFVIVYKKLGKLPVQNHVAWVDYCPKTGDDTYWYDISTEDKLSSVIEELESEIDKTAIKISIQLEEDYESAIKDLLDNHFDEYHLKLDFVADILGMDSIIDKAHKIFTSLSDKEKQQVEDYLSGKMTSNWMYNPTNLKFIVDNKLYI